MAYAEAQTETVTSVVGYTLVLSTKEAEILADVLAKVAGDPVVTSRYYTNKIAKALKSAGVMRSALTSNFLGTLDALR